jgi:hypothetical protein
MNDLNEEIKSSNAIDEKYYAIGCSYILPLSDTILNETKSISKYKYNTNHLTCSCKAYRDRTKLYPRRDLRRLCKHLYLSLLTNHITDMDSLTKLLVETNLWFGRKILFKSKNGDSDFYFCLTIPVDKIYVFVKNNTWHRYEYGFKEDYWSNNLYPHNYDKLVVKIKKVIFNKITLSKTE